MVNQQASKFVLGVDLDGVCANFMAGLRPIAADWLGVDADSLTDRPSVDYPEWGLDEAGGFDDLYRYAVTRRGLFRDLPEVPGASLSLRRLWTKKRIRIRIITYRLYFEFFHREAIGQTIEWLDHHDFPYWDLCFMRDKAAVGADLYLEDSAANVKALRAAGHQVIAFIHSQNQELEAPRAETWEEVEAQVLHAVDQWEKMQAGGSPLAGT